VVSSAELSPADTNTGPEYYITRLNRL